MAISAPGIGSNLDVNSIVTQLLQIEQRPLLLLAQKEASFQARLSSLGTIKGALSSLQTAGGSLKATGTISFSASSSESTSVSASALPSANAGTYAVNVTQLAQAQRLVTAGQASETAAIGGGSDTTLTISFGTISGGSFDSDTGQYTGASFAVNPDKASFSVTINSTNNTLEGIRDAINAENRGVTASIVNDGGSTPYRLALSVTDTGAANSLKVAVSGEAAIGNLLAQDPAGTQNLAEKITARNALLTVDGTDITRTTNSVSGAIAGVTLTLAKVTTSEVTITITRNYSSASTALAALVKAYNDFNGVVAGATGKGAVLQGDGGVIGIQQRLRLIIGSSYGDSGPYRNLSALGVSFQRDGALTFDPAKLSAALAANPAAAINTLTAAGTAVRALADTALGNRGAIAAGTASINASIKDIGTRREQITRHLVTAEKQYRAQFSALDVLLGKMNQTSAFLQQQLTILSNLSSGNGSR